MARAGFLAIAAVYVTLGIVAARAAAGWGGRPTDQPGAIRALGRQPAGGVLSLLVGLGLVGYAAWRFVQAFADPEGKGTSWRALVTRSEFCLNGLLHLALALTAFGIALGVGSAGLRREWAVSLLAEPAALWALGAAGALAVGAGAYQFYKAAIARFERDLETDRMTPAGRRWARRLGRFGMIARGITFEIVGFFLLRACLHANPQEARGIAGALGSLQRQEHGALFLGVVALGLVAYGLFALVLARYHRIAA